jgi:predicted GNAT superfamily acetyltransferase
VVDFRVLKTMEELEQVVDLEILIWNLNPRDAVPANMMHPITLNGGLVVGAYEASNLVGMAFAFPVKRGKKWILWSHMTGVHPKNQAQGIGFGLKQTQRQWALQYGYDTLSWTYDPLQRGNANFNIHLLGATASVYHVNFYGEMTDGINAGLPSDRLEVVWPLKDRRVQALAVATESESVSTPVIDAENAPFLLSTEGTENKPHLHFDTLTNSPNVLYAEIPYNIGGLKAKDASLALEWRLMLREALEKAFAQGYSIVDFATAGSRCWYILLPQPAWFLYVLECADNSLYTGITLNPHRRVKQHNSGRGAAYTKTRRPVKLVKLWRFPDQSTALKAEHQFKQFSRNEKIKLLKTNADFFGGVLTALDTTAYF